MKNSNVGKLQATPRVKVGHKFVIDANSSDNYERPFNKLARGATAAAATAGAAEFGPP